MKQKLFIIFLLPILGLNAQNKAQELWIKNSPEIRMNIKDTPFEFRWRPIDQMIMPDYYFGKHSLIRTDIMIGVNVWKFKIFNYTKLDEFNRYWTGARIDLNLDFFNKKLLVNLQGRYFFGLNKKSSDHYYQVQYIRYVTTDKIHLGILSYGKTNTDEGFNEGEWFIGPSFFYKFPLNISFHVALTRNVFGSYQNMLFVRLGYKFKV
ncbi:MAG: hypothetical protein JXR68_05195 [Bacteroidales bacterium]|nr:hypothetical protein [Bacteroidales bacterium]